MKDGELANLDLHHLVPAVAADGHIVFIASGSDIPTLTFFQIRKQEGAKVSADVVASVRMNGLDDLKNLQNAIADVIAKHTNREP